MGKPTPKALQNLKPVKSKEEARERGRKGGIASGIAYRKKKTMRQMMQLLLSLPVSSSNKAVMQQLGIENEEDQNYKMLVAVGLMRRASTGDPRAVEVLCGIAGDIFTIPKDKEDDEAQEDAIDRLKDFEIKFVDASKEEKNNETNSSN